MKFSIRSIFVITLVVAMGIQTAIHWNQLGTARAEIQFFQSKIARQRFDPQHVEMITAICESAVEQYPDSTATFFPTVEDVQGEATDE